MKKRVCILLLVWLLPATGFCGEMIRQVQEELRKRNLYFGEIDGNPSKGLQKALAKYQQVKGFTVNGVPAPETLRSLGLQEAGPEIGAMTPLPDVVVLKSDAPRELTEADRKVVELSVGELPTPGEGPMDVGGPLSGNLVALPEVSVESSSAQTATTEEIRPSDAEVAAFVKEYLATCEANDLNGEMAHYGSTVDYFDHGRREQEFIRKDVQHYYKRWPTRKYELEDLEVAAGASNEKLVRFRLRFAVSNNKSTAKGETNNLFTVRREGDQLKFVAMKEQRLRK